ncbi:MAG: type II toxin-antitoxin system death-on-curing family toxin [Blastocatellia bacterium]
MTIYPTIDEVLIAHARLIARFGGAMGLRDPGALESAIARPRIGYYDDVIAEAAAMWESLSQNHPFLDGNKRTAIAVTAAFLRVNGHGLAFDDLEAYKHIITLYETGNMHFEALERWLRKHIELSK